MNPSEINQVIRERFNNGPLSIKTKVQESAKISFPNVGKKYTSKDFGKAIDKSNLRGSKI